MAPERCQNVIIGSGEGGKYLAWHLAQLGQPTIVIERRWIGGSCPNINCLPSKNEIWSAKVADLVRHAADFGTTNYMSIAEKSTRQRVTLPSRVARRVKSLARRATRAPTALVAANLCAKVSAGHPSAASASCPSS